MNTGAETDRRQPNIRIRGEKEEVDCYDGYRRTINQNIILTGADDFSAPQRSLTATGTKQETKEKIKQNNNNLCLTFCILSPVDE